MSWTYSGDPSTSALDECRFLLQDTNESQPILQNEEIQYLITMYEDSQNDLYYNLFARAATLFARDIKRSLGPQSEDPTDRLAFYKEQMQFYRTQRLAKGLSLPAYNSPKVFYKEMQNNPPWPRPKE